MIDLYDYRVLHIDKLSTETRENTASRRIEIGKLRFKST